MKYFIASDLHGSAHWCRLLLQAFERERADRLILLGDLLYHGPRNDLPEEYAPKEVIAMLNAYAPRMLCVRGNCEAEVDQMVLQFPVMADYAVLHAAGRLIYLTHGHLFGAHNPPKLCKGDILLTGHTHVPACKEYTDFVYMNPGSVSMPKEDSWHGYMTLEDAQLLWKDLQGNVQLQYKL